MAGRRRAPCHLRGAEDAGATRGARAADVCVEIVERALAEEDRVRQGAVPGRERGRLSLRVCDRDRHERWIDRAERRRADLDEVEVVAVDRVRSGRLRQRHGLVRAGNVDHSV